MMDIMMFRQVKPTYFILAIVLAFSVSCKSQNFAGGDGTEKKPYLIDNKEQLKMFAAKVNSDSSFSKGKFFALKKDISLKDDTLFMSIGKSRIFAFYGCFDGKKHCISDMKDSTAIFLYNKGVIKNLTLKDSELKGGNQMAGICAFNDSIIENYINYATIEGKSGEKGGGGGGICVFNKGLITKCANYGRITGRIFNTGGICSFNSGHIENCLNEGLISGNTRNGSICGYNKGVIKNCLSLSSVAGQKETGAICGSNDNETEINKETLRRDKIKQIGTVENCFFNTDSCNIAAIGAKADKSIDTNVVGYTTEQLKSGTIFNDTANWVEKKGKYPRIKTK